MASVRSLVCRLDCLRVVVPECRDNQHKPFAVGRIANQDNLSAGGVCQHDDFRGHQLWGLRRSETPARPAQTSAIIMTRWTTFSEEPP